MQVVTIQHCKSSLRINIGGKYLDELFEGTIDGRADLGALVEVDGGNGALTDALGGKLKFLVLR